MNAGDGETALRRTLGLPLLVLLGIGTMVGGGFYALLGEVAALAGPAIPWALGLSGGIALLNAVAFAALAKRFPVSAGVARYLLEAFGSRRLAAVSAWLVATTGVVSAATLSVATAGFVHELTGAPTLPLLAGTVLLLGAVAAWGIGESMALVAIVTVLEVGVLLLIVALDAPAVLSGGAGEALNQGAVGVVSAAGVVSAVFLAFYAFLGFEDMVTMAEETKRPRNALPWAIGISVVVTTSLYLLVSLVAVRVTSLEELSASRTPVAVLLARHGGWAELTARIVSVLTGVNGALVQILMASRVLYGTAVQGDAPQWLASVHPRRRTPLRATALVTVVILVLAVALPLKALAEWTSAIILVVFALVNAAWIRVGSRERRRPRGFARAAALVPWLGAGSCVGLLVFRGLQAAGMV